MQITLQYIRQMSIEQQIYLLRKIKKTNVSNKLKVENIHADYFYLSCLWTENVFIKQNFKHVCESCFYLWIIKNVCCCY